MRVRAPAYEYHTDTPDLRRSSRRAGRPDRTTDRTGSGGLRLVVHECLRREEVVLHAVLPLPAEEYCKDFATAASRREFNDLLAPAVSVEFAETVPTREEAYERAGHMMVARSDLVLAVWDGQPARGRGGTADIVEHARARGVLIVRIDGQVPIGNQR